MTSGTVSAPIRLSSDHDLLPFSCGTPSLDHWLKGQALKNDIGGTSRTYVICQGDIVVGYYALAAGAIVRNAAPKSMQRNSPDPIPVIVLGRLAVDQSMHGQGLGRGLLKDAILRALQAAEIAGIKALLVHAISDDAKQFYLRNGFSESSIDAMTLCLPLATARKALE